MNFEKIDPMVLKAADDDNAFITETNEFFDRNSSFYSKASLSETCAADGYLRAIRDIQDGKLDIKDIMQ